MARAKGIAQLVAGVASAIAASLALNALIVGSIRFFWHRRGFWLGMVAFSVAWLVLGLVVLWAMGRFWPERSRPADMTKPGWMQRQIARLATRSRFLAAIAVAWYFGPLTGPPFFRLLGYRNRDLTLWVVASVPVFCPFWYVWTLGGSAVVRAALARI